jgi:hypothetical protein
MLSAQAQSLLQAPSRRIGLGGYADPKYLTVFLLLKKWPRSQITRDVSPLWKNVSSVEGKYQKSCFALTNFLTADSSPKVSSAFGGESGGGQGQIFFSVESK